MTAFLIINYGGIEGIMANLDSQNDRVAIIYTPINQSLRVREEERFADEEEQEVAVYVKEALALAGRSADILCLDLDHLEKLAGYAGVFNLVENYSGCDPNLESNFARRLQELGLPFTGPGALTLKTCLNKADTKARILQHGLLSPAYSVIKPGDAIQTGLPFPLFVKPVQEDGSLGVGINSEVNSQADLVAKVQEIHDLYHEPALVEEFIDGRDISVAILGNDADLQVLPPREIIFEPGFVGPKVLTYEASWVTTSAAYAYNKNICPCPLNDHARELMMIMARLISQFMGCQDYTRVDFRLRGNTPYALEVNPKPSIHPDSGFSLCARAAGLDYSAMVNTILDQALRKQPLQYRTQPARESLRL